jgi:hypothetical protein
MESEMKTDIPQDKLTDAIAELIVRLVNNTDGPVTFVQIDLEVPGFAKKDPPTWDYVIKRSDTELLIWTGMTEAGYRALRKVVSERRVAIQFVDARLYFIRDVLINDAAWAPAVLIPAKAANLETPRRLIRAAETSRDYIMARAAAEGIAGYRRLTPDPLRFTADQFSL